MPPPSITGERKLEMTAMALAALTLLAALSERSPEPKAARPALAAPSPAALRRLQPAPAREQELLLRDMLAHD